MRDQIGYTDFIHPIDRDELISLKKFPTLFINVTIPKYRKILGIIPFSGSLQMTWKIPKIVKSFKDTRLI